MILTQTLLIGYYISTFMIKQNPEMNKYQYKKKKVKKTLCTENNKKVLPCKYDFRNENIVCSTCFITHSKNVYNRDFAI